MINLKETIEKYPECLESAEKFKSFMLDLYPDLGDRARIKVLTDVFSSGIVNEIREGKDKSVDISKYLASMENDYGYSIRLINESIKCWIEAFETETSLPDNYAAIDELKQNDIVDNLHIHKYVKIVVPSTCKEGGCIVHRCKCGYEYKDNYTLPINHKYEEVDRLDATCIQEGRIDYLCSFCGNYMSEKIPKSAHIMSDWNIKIKPTCNNDGKEERYCTICKRLESREVSARGHDWNEWIEQKHCTCFEDGIKVRQCKICGTVEQQEIKSKGHSWGQWKEQVNLNNEKSYSIVRQCKDCGEIEKIELILDDIIFALKTQFNDISIAEQLKSKQKELEKDKKLLDKIENNLVKANSFISNYDSVKLEIEELSKPLSQKKEDINKLINERNELGIFSIREKKNNDKERCNLEAEIKSIESKIEALNDKISGFKSKKNAENIRDKYNRQIVEINNRIETINNTMDIKNVILLYENSQAAKEIISNIYPTVAIEFLQAEKGDTIKFGNYNDIIEWIVLKKEKNRMLVISKYGFEINDYRFWSNRNGWDTCFIRKWLNHEFMGLCFTEDDKRKIKETKIYTPKNNCYYSYDIASNDRLFLLKSKEIEKYFESSSERHCKYIKLDISNKSNYEKSKKNCCWYLRDWGELIVDSKGTIREYKSEKDNPVVRPALWINLKP